MRRPERILVVGAGIAGCSAAIALASRGFGVTLVEKQAEWRFQSSGIFIYGNGLEALRAVGVLPRILEAGFAIEDGRNVYLDHLGAPIVDVFYPRSQGGAAPIVGIKRSEMHRVLADQLAALGVEIRLATTVERIAAEGERARRGAARCDPPPRSRARTRRAAAADARSARRACVPRAAAPSRPSAGDSAGRRPPRAARRRTWRAQSRRPSSAGSLL